MRYRCARVQGHTAVVQQVPDVPISRSEKRLILKTLHDNASSVAKATLDEQHADGNLLSATQPTLDGLSGSGSANEDHDPVGNGASKETDPARLGIGFAHVLRGVYGVDSLWLEPSKRSLLRDIGAVVADSYESVHAHAFAHT